MVAAIAISGDLGFNPLTDYLTNDKGEQFKFTAPHGDELPLKGFDVEDPGYQAPVEDGSGVVIAVAPDSSRLQLLENFPIWDGKNILGAKLLIKAKGKCTTDHISMAGPWLRYRGHLDNISNNMLIGAENAFNGKANAVVNQLTGVDMKGCTYYKIIAGNIIKCSPVWLEGYKQTQSMATSQE
jgi:aconitate hydratase